MSNIAIINDNNNFAPSIFWSLCEFVGDCFGPRYFSLGATLPQKNTSVQNSHLRFHKMTLKKMVRSHYCLSKLSGKLKNVSKFLVGLAVLKLLIKIWQLLLVKTYILLFWSISEKRYINTNIWFTFNMINENQPKWKCPL